MLSMLGSHSLDASQNGLDAASENLKAIGFKRHRVNPEHHKTSWSEVSTRHLLSAASWVSCCISSDNWSIPACVCVRSIIYFPQLTASLSLGHRSWPTEPTWHPCLPQETILGSPNITCDNETVLDFQFRSHDD